MNAMTSSFSIRQRPRHPAPGPARPGGHRQRGAALIMALIFLVLLTILAITASSGSLLQLRMAGNLRNAQQAQLSANTALRGAEWKMWASANHVGSHLTCTDGSISSEDGCVLYNPATTATYGADGTVTRFRTSYTWPGDIGKAYTGPTAAGYTSEDMQTARLAANPRYIIEDMGRILPPGAGPQHESGATGPQNAGPGTLSPHAYRITARATGGSATTMRAAQSTFDAQTNN